MIHKYLVNKVRWPIPCSWLLYRRHRKAALLRVIHSGKRQRSGERCCHRRPWHLGQHHAPAEEWHTPPLGILWPVSVVARNRVWILGIQSKQSTGFTSLLYFNEINSLLVSRNHTHLMWTRFAVPYLHQRCPLLIVTEAKQAFSLQEESDHQWTAIGTGQVERSPTKARAVFRKL